MQKLLWQGIGVVVCFFILLGGGLCLWRTPDALAQLDRVTVAVALAPPFVFEDETGALAGFDIELLDALAAQAGLRFTYAKTEFRYLLPGVVTRLYDVGAGCIVITPERQAQLVFTRPYFTSGLTIIVKADNMALRSLTDITPQTTIGVVDGSAAQTFAQTHITATIHPVLTSDASFAKVGTGELNGALVSEAEFLAYQLHNPEAALQTVGGLLTYGECGLAISQSNGTLLEQLDSALAALKDNGGYNTLYQKWFGDRPMLEKPTEPPPAADGATPMPSPTPTPAAVNMNPVLTPTNELAGIYYLTIDGAGTAPFAKPAAAHYQLLTLAANGLWFISESPDPQADGGSSTVQPTGQSGLWDTNGNGQVEATLLAFTTPAQAGAAEVIRKDYQMQVDGSGHVTGVYQLTYYATTRFASTPPPTATMTQTVEFTGQRVK